MRSLRIPGRVPPGRRRRPADRTPNAARAFQCSRARLRMQMEVRFPELALVILVGTSGSGKSTFARRHFLPTETISSDYCRGLVSDNENDQAATKSAFEVLHFIVSKRLEAGRLTVVDAPNVRQEDRKVFIEIARRFHMLPVALVFDLPESLCQ